jgi:cobalt-zinc-cadmium efflux system outer membrane protein
MVRLGPIAATLVLLVPGLITWHPAWGMPPDGNRPRRLPSADPLPGKVRPAAFQSPSPLPDPLDTTWPVHLDRLEQPPETALAAQPLTLEQLQQWALANNPSLGEARELVQQAQGTRLQVGLYPNPTVGYQSEEIGEQGDAGQHGGFIGQQIVTAGKLELNRAVASQDLQIAQWQWEAQRLRVLTDVQVAYFRLLGAQQSSVVAHDLVVILEEGVRAAQALLDALQAPRTDLLQAQIELGTVRILLQNAQQQQQAARRQLAAVVGLPSLPSAPVEGNLAGGIAQLQWQTAWDRLRMTSPLLQIAQTQIERARAQVCREQAQVVPDLNVRAGVNYDFAGDQTLVGAEAGIMLPIHNRNQGNILAAMARLRQATHEAERLERFLQQQLAEAFQRYEMARSRVELYRTAILPPASENLELTTQGYRMGELDFLRVLTARRSYAENEINYIAALAELRSAAAEIDGMLLTGALQSPTNLPGFGGGTSTPGGNVAGAGQDLTATPKTD